MDFAELAEFVTKRMRMTHIYQYERGVNPDIEIRTGCAALPHARGRDCLVIRPVTVHMHLTEVKDSMLDAIYDNDTK